MQEVLFGESTLCRYYIRSDGTVRVEAMNGQSRVTEGNANPATGYKIITYREEDGTYKTGSIHKLVAEAFLPNPENFVGVRHKNGDRGDNRVENLEWYPRGQFTPKPVKAPSHACLVVKGEKDGVTRFWKNGGDCARELGRTPGMVYAALEKRAGANTCAGWDLQWIDINELAKKI